MNTKAATLHSWAESLSSFTFLWFHCSCELTTVKLWLHLDLTSMFVVWLCQRPRPEQERRMVERSKSHRTQVPSAFTSTLELLRSLWATGGLCASARKDTQVIMRRFWFDWILNCSTLYGSRKTQPMTDDTLIIQKPLPLQYCLTVKPAVCLQPFRTHLKNTHLNVFNSVLNKSSMKWNY